MEVEPACERNVILVREDHLGIITLTGGNGKRDFLSARDAVEANVDIVILDAGT